MPEMPSAYSMTVEINIHETNTSSVVHEFVDTDAGFARIDTHMHGRMTSIIMDYSTNMKYMIVDADNDNFMSTEFSAGDDTCTRSFLNESTGSYFTDPDTKVMKSVAQLFSIDKDEEYVERGEMRGVDVDIWRTKDVNTWDLDSYGNNITLRSTYKHAFAAAGWSMLKDAGKGSSAEYGTSERYPMEIYHWLKTTNKTTGSSTVSRLTYSIVGFWPGSPDRSIFTTGNMVCIGPISAAAAVPLPSLPEQARMVIEANYLDKEYTSYIEEAFDFPNNRARFLTRHNNADGSFDKVLELDYYDTGMQIQIVNDDICVANGMADADAQARGTKYVSKAHSNRIQSAAEVFHFGLEYNETYAGQYRVRGITSDKWVIAVNGERTSRPDMDADASASSAAGIQMKDYYSRYTMSYYFSAKAWTKGGSDNIHRIPVRAEIQGFHADLSAGKTAETTSSANAISKSSHMVVCGKVGQCTDETTHTSFAEASELDTTRHEVRCCSETQLTPTWRQNPGCSVWGGSDEGGECAHDSTYEEAARFCVDQGARLCTMEEVQADCTASTGCTHDFDHVWTGTPTRAFHTFYEYIEFEAGEQADADFSVPQGADCHLVSTNHTMSYWLGNINDNTKPKKAVAAFKATGVGELNGWFIAQQEAPDQATVVEIVLSGLTTDPRFEGMDPAVGMDYHLHKLALDPLAEIDPSVTPTALAEQQLAALGCDAADGGLYNPTGDAPVMNCTASTPEGCTAGELAGRHGNLMGNKVITAYFDTKLQLFGLGATNEGSAIGTILVMHTPSGAKVCAVLRDFAEKDYAPAAVSLVQDIAEDLDTAVATDADEDGTATIPTENFGCVVNVTTGVTCDADAVNDADDTEMTNGAEAAVATDIVNMAANVTDSETGETEETTIAASLDQHGCVLSSSETDFTALEQWCNFTSPPQCVLQGTVCIDAGAAAAHLKEIQAAYQAVVTESRVNATAAREKLNQDNLEYAALQLELNAERTKYESQVTANALVEAQLKAAAGGLPMPVVSLAWPKGVDSACAISKCAEEVAAAVADPQIKRALDCTSRCADGWTKNCIFQCASANNLTAATELAGIQMRKYIGLEACIDASACLQHEIGWSFGVNSYCADGSCAKKQADCMASERCRQALACAKTPDGGHWTPEHTCTCALKADAATTTAEDDPMRKFFADALSHVNQTLMEQQGFVQAADAVPTDDIGNYICLDPNAVVGVDSPSAQQTPKGLFLAVVRCLVSSGCTDEGREAMVETLAVSESFGKGVDSRCIHRHCSAQMGTAGKMVRSAAALDCVQNCELYNEECHAHCAVQNEIDADRVAAVEGALIPRMEEWETDQAARLAGNPDYVKEVSPLLTEMQDLSTRKAEMAAFNAVHTCTSSSGCLEMVWQWKAGVHCMMQRCTAQQAACMGIGDCGLAYQCTQQHCAPWTDECASDCRDAHATTGAAQFNALVLCADTEHECMLKANTVVMKDTPKACGSCVGAIVGAIFAGLFIGGPFWWCIFGRQMNTKQSKFAKMSNSRQSPFDDDDFGGGGGGMTHPQGRQQAV
jgi:hypothetical protein